MVEWKVENLISIYIFKWDDMFFNVSMIVGRIEIMNVIRMRFIIFMDFIICFFVWIFCCLFLLVCLRLEVVLICILCILYRVRKYRMNVRLRVRVWNELYIVVYMVLLNIEFILYFWIINVKMEEFRIKVIIYIIKNRMYFFFLF